jgi:hypothetical protein
MDARHLAAEADRLANDPIFLKAIEEIRNRSLDALVHADPNSATGIARLQAKVSVCDDIRSELAAMISAAQTKPRPAFV